MEDNGVLYLMYAVGFLRAGRSRMARLWIASVHFFGNVYLEIGLSSVRKSLPK